MTPDMLSRAPVSVLRAAMRADADMPDMPRTFMNEQAARPFDLVRFLSDFRKDTLTVDAYREAQGQDAADEVTCTRCGITLSASAMLACSGCAT